MTTPVLLDDIAAALVNAGVANAVAKATDWKVALGYMPDQPDRVVCVYPRPGVAPLEAWAIDYPQFQVRVRGKESDIALVNSKLQASFNTLHSNEVNIGGKYVYCYAMHSGVIPFGKDEKGRYSAAINFRTMRETV